MGTKHNSWKNVSAACASLIGLCAFANPASAELNSTAARYTTAGVLDTTFDGDGLFFGTATGDDSYNDVVLDSSGKVVLCGDFTNGSGATQMIVGRLNTNGTVDTGFGFLGVTTVSWPNETSAKACAIDSSGRIVVAVQEGDIFDFAATPSFLLVRFNSNGALDGTFGIAGFSGIGLAGAQDVFPWSIRIASDGKIITAGDLDNTAGSDEAFVTRHGTNGVLDTTFSGDGIVRSNLGFANTSIWSMALDSSNRPVLAGSASSSMLLARFTTGGVLDTTFSGDGLLSISFAGQSSSDGHGVLVDSSGKIVVAGSMSNAAFVSSFALARVTAAGALDTTFSGDGKQTTSFASNAAVYDIGRASDGKLLVSGYTQSGAVFSMTVGRYTTAGALDTTFSGDGLVTTSLSPLSSFPFAIAVDSSNRPVTAGNRQ